MPHGKLTVIVESASGIKHPSKHGSGDSYCTLQCGTQLLSTHVANGEGSNPLFHTEFKFKIDRSTNDLVVSVYSRDNTAESDQMVGSITLDFKTVFFDGHAVPLTAYPLTRRSGKSGGHISISLTFTMRPSPHAHNSLHAVACQHSAPLPQRARNQQHDYETYHDGYGSFRSDGSAHGHPHAHHKRSQSQPLHRDDYGSPRAQPQYAHARASGAVPVAAVAAHRAMANGLQPGAPQRAVGGLQQGRHHPHPHPHPHQHQQQIVQQGQHHPHPHPHQHQQHIVQQVPQQQHQAHGVVAELGAQVAKAVAHQVLRQGVHAAFGELGSLFD